MGSLLYNIGGYITPFLFFGLFGILIALILLCTLKEPK
jgi:hypothetical protein